MFVIISQNKTFINFIKYMGSKTEMLEPIIEAINEIHHDQQPICDLFSGSATLSAALRDNNVCIISNDIQYYSAVFATAYLSSYDWGRYEKLENIVEKITVNVQNWIDEFPELWQKYNYQENMTLELFMLQEEEQRLLMKDNKFYNAIKLSTFSNVNKYYFFVQNYSGTYWSFRQCVWIDACRAVIDEYKDSKEFYNLLLACAMFAMAYTSQGTGHYAQYRRADNEKSMNDVLIYRCKEFIPFFERKFNEVKSSYNQTITTYNIMSSNFSDCIQKMPQNALYYADPPYGSVHYSRFYHILETFVKYDYPTLEFGGRYRDDRHQSPFCITTKVESAFSNLFFSILNKHGDLILSYSNSETTMISLERLLFLAYSIFNEVDIDLLKQHKECINNAMHIGLQNNQGDIIISISEILNPLFNVKENYKIVLKLFSYQHSKLGRAEEQRMSVYETLILIKKVRQ